jgi:glycosyltransferase involved in cell wall biosynthesis
VATLESQLPASLPTRVGTAVFVHGHGADTILVDGTPHRAEAAAGAFWAVVPIPPRDRPGAIEIALAAAGAVTPAGRIEVVERAAAAPATDDRIAVCMATYEPDRRLFQAQIESLRAQTDDRWLCVISDDASEADVAAMVAGDERFVVSRADQRRGFYGNFERALALAPPGSRLLALCDQDDRWHPDKLATLRAALGDAVMVYSDQRLVDAEGRVLRDTLWQGRRNNHTDIASLLVANSITGAATLFRREIADLALPFPLTPGLPFHDHWLGLVALAAGDVGYVDRPLYDYVQHGGAVFGDVSQGGAERGTVSARGAYFRGYVHRQVLARALLVRCGGRIAPRKRRQLDRFLAAERAPSAFAWLLARALTRRRETLGSELELARGIAWRRLRPRTAELPELLSYQQRPLRRWRARI